MNISILPNEYIDLFFIFQGYEHSCNDPSMLYRVETMPGLGWYKILS